MSRTACCFLALGIGVTLAAACGDDDVDFTGMGGSGGRGGAAGTAGTGGSSGSAGRGGSGGTGGSIAGQGGDAGSNAGTGGGTSGTGGTGGTGDIPDGGTDAAPPDGGGSGDCPNFAAAGLQIDSANPIVIARVIFDAAEGEASVVLRCNDSECLFGDEMHLCSGPENCLPLTDLDNLTAVGQETPPIVIGDTVIAEGELAVMTNTPDVAAAFPLAYIAWGATFESPDPLGGDASDVPQPLDVRADPNVWELEERILPAAGDNAFIGDGDSALAEGFTTCTAD